MEEVLGEEEKTIAYSARTVCSWCRRVAVLRFPLHDKRASPCIIGKLTLTRPLDRLSSENQPNSV